MKKQAESKLSSAIKGSASLILNSAVGPLYHSYYRQKRLIEPE